MLSVIIPTRNCERALVRTLAMLVGASVSGVVRDVVVADAGSSDETGEIAEIAGCTLLVSSAPLAARLREAVAAARGSWLLFLRPGTVLEAGWGEEAMRFIADAELCDRMETAAVFRAQAGGADQPLLRSPSVGAPHRCAATDTYARAGPRDQTSILRTGGRPSAQGRRSGGRPLAPARRRPSRPAAQRDHAVRRRSQALIAREVSPIYLTQAIGERAEDAAQIAVVEPERAGDRARRRVRDLCKLVQHARLGQREASVNETVNRPIWRV